jgi:hypothetical protein
MPQPTGIELKLKRHADRISRFDVHSPTQTDQNRQLMSEKRPLDMPKLEQEYNADKTATYDVHSHKV